MSWWRKIRKNASALLENKKAVKKVITESADVWIEYIRANEDGTIATAEYVQIGKEALETAKAAYELARIMGWRKP